MKLLIANGAAIPKQIWDLYLKDKQLYVDYDPDVQNNRHTKVRFTVAWKKLNKAIMAHLGMVDEKQVLAYHWKLQDHWNDTLDKAPEAE
jgi:hypothetical protein